MAAELGLLSLNQLQKLAAQSSQQGPNHPNSNPNPTLLTPGSTTWMWNPKAQPVQEEVGDDSWEVRAFAEDTGNIMGTTWPPRSYTCNFCRREFRSAQALGGHMNVHRRDRARLHHHHQTQPPSGSSINPTSPSSSAAAATTSLSSTLLIPTQEFATNGGLCLLYQLPNRNGVFTSQPIINACSVVDSPSTHLSISPYPPNNLIAPPSVNFPVTPPPELINHSSSSSASASSLRYSSKAEVVPSSMTTPSADNNNCKETSMEELDLELRLGHRPATS